MNAYRVKPMTFPWTPIVYVVALMLALSLHRLRPLHIESGRVLLEVLGMLIAASGVALAVWAYTKLVRSRTGLFPTSPATHLVTTGPYRFTRNPIYLGYTLAMMGTGLLVTNYWMAIIAGLTAIVTHAWIIRSEERHLLARFGFEFEYYCRRTRAWI
jgi:protein-S-isoprenylcysteine O-methyltransferase Ste14